MPQKFFPVPNADAYVGDFSAQNLLDGSDVLVRIVCRVPADFISLNDINVVFVPAGTGNLRYSLATDFGEACNDEAYNTHSDSIAATDLAVTTDELECIDISAGVIGVAAGDVIGVEFTRYGSHVNDTVGASVFLLGVVLDYERPPEPPVDTGGGLYPVVYPPQFELPFVPPLRRIETTGIMLIYIRKPVVASVQLSAAVRRQISETVHGLVSIGELVWIQRQISDVIHASVSIGKVTHVSRWSVETVVCRGYVFSDLQLLEVFQGMTKELQDMNRALKILVIEKYEGSRDG